MKQMHFDFTFPVVAVVEVETLQQVPETAGFNTAQSPHVAELSGNPHAHLLNKAGDMQLSILCPGRVVAEIQPRAAPPRICTQPRKRAALVMSAAFISGLRTERLKTEVHRGQPPPTNLTGPFSQHTAA